MECYQNGGKRIRWSREQSSPRRECFWTCSGSLGFSRERSMPFWTGGLEIETRGGPCETRPILCAHAIGKKAEAICLFAEIQYSCMQVRGPWHVIHAATATYLTLTGPRRARLARPTPARERYPKRSGRMRAKRLERQAYAE